MPSRTRPPLGFLEPGPHPALTQPQADAVLLHDGLGLDVEKTASLMGREDHFVRALLRSASRTG